ncbi:MAG: hypothetical protein U1F76_00845 [Candidatus Competibacteraceae bacterium]
MILETIGLLSEDNAGPDSAGSWLEKLQELLAIDIYSMDLKQIFQTYETVIARVFGATDCTIVLFHRGKQKRLSNPITASSSNHKTEENVPTNPVMCPLINNDRMIGFISIQAPKDGLYPACNTLELLDVVASIVAKVVQIKQLHGLISMRCRVTVPSKPIDSNSILREIAESPHSANTAKAFAKLIYQDMMKAGFSHNNIIYVASELISELNHNLTRMSHSSRSPGS